MLDPSSAPACILIVADPPRASELAGVLAAPLPQGAGAVLVSSGGDDTIDLFEAHRPRVVVLTATLETGDAASLIEALRAMVPPAEVGIVLVGDDDGPIRTAIDAIELAPDRFVSSPVAANALRFAIGSALEQVELARGSEPAPRPSSTDAPPVGAPPLAPARTVPRLGWGARADSFAIEEHSIGDARDDAAPLPPPILIRPRHADPPLDAEGALPQAWQPGTTAELPDGGPGKPWAPTTASPPREPTLVIEDAAPAALGRLSSVPMATPVPTAPEASGAHWSGARPLAQLRERDTRELEADPLDELDELVGPDDQGAGMPVPIAPAPAAALAAAAPAVAAPVVAAPAVAAPAAPSAAAPGAHDGRDFARQLRAKMSMMAQRLFQGADAAAPAPVDVGPRHDHHTEIDLASLGEELALDRGGTEIEPRALPRSEARESTTSPGTWNTQIRERGVPDTGEVVRGISDAAMLLAKVFAQGSTGRISFRQGDVEKVIYVDQGRPVFASSSEPRDRMGELLVREGKITAAQYERCQGVVAESGRRMGEILVGFGYLKRRELLPAVRRHVEDIIYSLFGWDHGTYQLAIDATACAERIRLSRHPAALILEGVRRKLDRTSLERLIGSASTVIEVPDRERLGGLINLGDLVPEERAALAAFDGQADLAMVARVAGADIADVLPLAWGLCVLGLATARRMDTEVPEEGSALVGETDLEIDRERVRARWQLVAEADYFALLGVRRDATAFEIRRAYQSVRRDFAADGFPQDLRRELAQELDDIAHVLDEAFRVLRDDGLRRTYLSNLVD